MVEQMTGLPISPRTGTCAYARVPAGEANNLEWIGSDFYRQNCVGCPHRQMRDVPNLATFVARLDTEADAERQRAQALAAEQERDRDQRRRARDLAAQGEPGPTRDLLRLIDRIDASDPDNQAGETFLAATQGAPELVTPGQQRSWLMPPRNRKCPPPRERAASGRPRCSGSGSCSRGRDRRSRVARTRARSRSPSPCGSVTG
jgi:hypothetical protein